MIDRNRIATAASGPLKAIIYLSVLAASGAYLAAPFLKPDRPMFSDKFLWRDNVIPRWTPPVLLRDEVGNRCAIDVPLNSILVCKPTSSPPTVGIVNV